MCDLWNDFELKKPPQVTLKVPNKKAPNVQRLQSAIYQYFRRHRPQETEFAEAAALLGRLMGRRKSSFRSMIGFRAVKKCNTATCRLLRIDITRELELFQGSLPDFNLNSAKTLELPTRNSFDYVLIRLLNVHGVYQRIRECCKQAAEYFTKMMRNNFFMETSTLLLAVLAKLYSLSALLDSKCVELYNQMQPMRTKFPLAERSTHHEFDLPEKIERLQDNQPLEIPKTEETLVSLVKKSDDTTVKQTPQSLTATHSIKKLKMHQRIDLGVEVSRESVTKKVHCKTFNVERELATVDATKCFIETENVSRKQSLKQSITKNILPHEWIGATRLFQRKLLANDDKKALSIFKKFIMTKIS
ncbi:uncharacterized protein [Eurosta solidaginis]|uniref:uncharacterized protein n=1 Tax=Eurosta solidaginis TaxID=178769 RepID=UPI0035306764